MIEARPGPIRPITMGVWPRPVDLVRAQGLAEGDGSMEAHPGGDIRRTRPTCSTTCITRASRTRQTSSKTQAAPLDMTAIALTSDSSRPAAIPAIVRATGTVGMMPTP